MIALLESDRTWLFNKGLAAVPKGSLWMNSSFAEGHPKSFHLKNLLREQICFFFFSEAEISPYVSKAMIGHYFIQMCLKTSDQT